MRSAPWLVVLLSGAVAQTLHLVLARFGVRRRPSVWAALCTALCTVVGFRSGTASLEFATAVAFACLILYDSLGLRRSAGRQGRLLNAIAQDLRLHETEAAGRHLLELLGETPAQLAGGLLVGLGVALPFVI